MDNRSEQGSVSDGQRRVTLRRDADSQPDFVLQPRAQAGVGLPPERLAAIPETWTFKTDAVAAGFDRHVREQLPWYDLMAGATAHIARHYISESGLVYDLGCSTGNIGRLLNDTLRETKATLVPIDNAQSMAALYDGPGVIEIADIADYSFQPFDVAIAFLSLMFIPMRRRAVLLEQLRAARHNGGAIIIVDKTEAIGGYLGTALARLTLAGKYAGGAPPVEIIQKELSLIGVQRPLKLAELGDAVEVFRFGEFAGFVIDQ